MIDRRSATDSPSSLTEDDASLRKRAAIVESSLEAMIGCTPDARVETWNNAATNVFGRTASEMTGCPVTEVIAPGRRDEFDQLLREAIRGQAGVLFRSTGQHADGHHMHLSISLSPLRLGGDEVTGVCMVARDVSAWRRAEEEADRSRQELVEREASLRQALTSLRASHEQVKQTQLQLIQAAKLETVGRLAAGVAHEVKNPLAQILAGTEYLLSLASGTANPALEPVLRDIRAAVDRASTVIGGLLNYSASTELKPSEADINTVLERALLLVRHALKQGHIHVEQEFATGLPPLQLDVPKIEQVFINLLLNAIDAMPEGGTLTLRTQRKQLTAADESAGLKRTDALRVGESVILASVSDTGSGISPEHLSRIFDPFFTTKPTGKGTGLGLAVSKTIVAMHGGTIWMANRPEGGVRATVVLRSFTGERR